MMTNSYNWPSAKFRGQRIQEGTASPAKTLAWCKENDPGRPAQQVEGIYVYLRPLITGAAILGILPVTVARQGSSGAKVQFRRWSPLTVYAAAIILVLGVSALVNFRSYFGLSSTDFKYLALALFQPLQHVFSTCSYILGLRLAAALPFIVQSWDALLEKLRKYSNPKAKTVGCVPIFLTVVVFVAFAGVDFGLNHGNVYFSPDCQNSSNALLCLAEKSFWFYEWLGPSTAVYTFAYISTSLVHFSTNFFDLIIVTFSLVLRNNFRVLAHYIRNTIKSPRSRSQWQGLREDHFSICKFAALLDNYLSPIILISYGSNVFNLLGQIYNGFRRSHDTTLDSVHTLWTFLHFLGRVTAVTFAAASLYDYACAPMKYLLRCPSYTYCYEVIKFMQHIKGYSMGLSGCNLFVVNRALYLSIIGLILTYELILLDGN